MARKRFISPQFFLHAELYDAEFASGLPLRVAFAGLWPHADRRGVFAWRPRELKNVVLPYDPVDFEKVLFALEAHGFIRRYVAEGKQFGVIPSFDRWQSFHHKEDPSDAPDPPVLVHGSSQPGANTGPTPGKPGASLTAPIAVAVAVAAPIAVAGTVDREVPARGQTGTQQPDRSNPSALVPSLTGPVSTTRHESPSVVPRELYAVQEQELRDAAPPHIALALTALMSRHSQPYTVVLEIHACATGLHTCRGKNGERATPEHALQAMWELAVNDQRWNVSLYRGYVRRCAGRISDLRTPEQRKLAKVEAEAIRFAPPAEKRLPEAEGKSREDIAREAKAAMDRLRAEFKKNTQDEAA